jgi:hypothetical protein
VFPQTGSEIGVMVAVSDPHKDGFFGLIPKAVLATLNE